METLCIANLQCCISHSRNLTPRQHATHFDGKLEAMNIALVQLFGRNVSLKKAAIFSDSTAVIQSLAKVEAPPQKKFTEIHLSVK